MSLSCHIDQVDRAPVCEVQVTVFAGPADSPDPDLWRLHAASQSTDQTDINLSVLLVSEQHNHLFLFSVSRLDLNQPDLYDTRTKKIVETEKRCTNELTWALTVLLSATVSLVLLGLAWEDLCAQAAHK